MTDTRDVFAWNRRACLMASLGAVAASPAARAAGQRVIGLLSGFAPGGLTAMSIQAIIPTMASQLGETIAPERRLGEGGDRALAAALKAPPDGSVIFAGHAAQMVVQSIGQPNRLLPSDDLTKIGLMARTPLVLCVHPSIPARTMPELVSWLKAQATPVPYGAASYGGLSHCAMQIFRARIGNPPMQGHPARAGEGEAMDALLRGHTLLMFASAAAALSPVRSDGVRPLMITRPVPTFANIPTVSSQGFAELEPLDAWVGLFAPPRTRPPVLRRMNAALNTALAQREVVNSLAALGLQPGSGTAEALSQRIAQDGKLWSGLAETYEFEVDS